MVAVYAMSVIAVVVIVVSILSWLENRKPRPKKVLTRKDAKLYREAAQIFDRVLNISSLSAGIPEDVLSPTTREQMESWLAQYRKELDK